MKLPKTVLVPSDFSAPSESALDYALSLAQWLEGTVHVVHAYQNPGLVWPDPYTVIGAETMEIIENASKKALAELLERKQAKGVRLEGHVRLGDPRTMLEMVASELHADLICMGTHGRRGLTHLLLGSVAEYTVRTSKIPVLTLRGPAA